MHRTLTVPALSITKKWIALPTALLVVSLALISTTYAAPGDPLTELDFNLTAENSLATGITWDGTHFFVVDQGSDRAHAYTADGTPDTSRSFDLHSGNSHPTGITWDGTHFFVVDRNDTYVYAYTADGTSDTSRSFDLDSGNTDPNGITWTGTHFFVTNSPDDTTANDGLYPYTSTGSSGNPLSLSANNSESQGIAWDGFYLKVAENTGRIYTYSSSSGYNVGNHSGVVSSRGVTIANGILYVTTVNTVVAIEGAGYVAAPSAPTSMAIARSADYTTATVRWEVYDAVIAYEIERLAAVQVDIADASRIEYGDPTLYMIDASSATSTEEYVDSTVMAHRTYQYRIRARGTLLNSWSPWTEYVFSGAKPGVDLPAPGNLALARDGESVTASWSAPPGDLDGYNLQRQELIVAEGSTFFGNVVNLPVATTSLPVATTSLPVATTSLPIATTSLPVATTTYTDNTIIPDLVYEYRVAAVKDDQVGTYTEWFRVGPVNTSLGAAPSNLGVAETGRRIFDARYEFWLKWDPVGRADDYEVQVTSFALASGSQATEEYVVTDATFFHTAYGRSAIRVRGRKLDSEVCGSAADDRCLTTWTAWADVRFTPAVPIEAPALTDPTTDEKTMELRAALADVITAGLDPIGSEVSAALVMEFVVLVAASFLAVTVVALTWRRGMAPLGAGMAAAISIMVLLVGHRLLGTSIAWVIAAEAAVVVAGLTALVRQFGIFR